MLIKHLANMKHPLFIIFVGCFCLSLTVNYVQHLTIQKMSYTIKKLEAGPWKSLFDKPFMPDLDQEKDFDLHPPKNESRFTLI